MTFDSCIPLTLYGCDVMDVLEVTKVACCLWILATCAVSNLLSCTQVYRMLPRRNGMQSLVSNQFHIIRSVLTNVYSPIPDPALWEVLEAANGNSIGTKQMPY